MGKTGKLIFEVYDICIISCVGLVEDAINLTDKLINQRDITHMKSTQEVDLHNFVFLAALLTANKRLI